ncbi:dehydrogenase, partial [Pseudomonas paraeruginosa]
MDLSYRRNASLISSNFSALDNQGARGDTWHLVVNGLWLLPRTAYFDTGNFIAEMAYSRVQRVTDHKD